jgi:hypothetical protein
LNVLATIYFALAFAKNVRIKSNFTVTIFSSGFKLSSGLIQEQRYRILYSCSFQDGNLLFTSRYITRGDFLEARAETSCCKIILICVIFDRL